MISNRKPSASFNTLVERLSSRLEAKAVLRVELVPDAQPEYAVRLVPWTSCRTTENRRLSPYPGTVSRPSLPTLEQTLAD